VAADGGADLSDTALVNLARRLTGANWPFNDFI
jgi:hypothetical protein